MKTAVPVARTLVEYQRALDELAGLIPCLGFFDQFDRALVPEGSDTVGSGAEEELGKAYVDAARFEAENILFSLPRPILSYAFALMRDARYSRLNRRSVLYNTWIEGIRSRLNQHGSAHTYTPAAEMATILEDPGNAPIETNIPYVVVK